MIGARLDACELRPESELYCVFGVRSEGRGDPLLLARNRASTAARTLGAIKGDESGNEHTESGRKAAGAE